MRWVRSRVHIPLIADEACLHPADIPRLVNSFDGVKLGICIDSMRSCVVHRVVAGCSTGPAIVDCNRSAGDEF